MVGLPSVREKDVKGLLFRQRAVITTRNWESISNFAVSLPNLSKGCEGATVPAVAALTLPRPAQGREKENSFPPLCIPPFLLMVLVSGESERVLQAREIRRIDFSAVYRHDLRFTCESEERCSHRQQKQARRTSLLCFA